MNYYLSLFLLCGFLAAAQEPGLAAKDAEIRKSLTGNPAYARTLIKEVLAMKPRLHDTVYANVYNYYGFYYNQVNNPDSSLYYYDRALPFTSAYPRLKAATLLRKGTAYRKKADYQASFTQLKMAERIDDSIGNILGKAVIYGEMASNYNQMHKYGKSVPYLMRAIGILEKEKNGAPHLPALRQRLAGTYQRMENYKFAIDMYTEVLRDFRIHNSMKNYYLTLINYGDCYFYLNEYARASKAWKEALEGLAGFKDDEMTGIVFSKLGKLAYEQQHYNEAEHSYARAFALIYAKNSYTVPSIGTEYLRLLNRKGKYNTALSLIKKLDGYTKNNAITPNETLFLEREKAVTFRHTDSHEKSLAALETALELNDSLNAASGNAGIRQLQARYQQALQAEKNRLLSKTNTYLSRKVADERRIRVLFASLCIAALAFIYTLVRHFRYRNRLRAEELRSANMQNRIIAQQYAFKQHNNDTLRKTLKEKEADLVSGAMQLAATQEHINEILALCKGQPDKASLALIRKRLAKLVKQGDYWTAFERKFNEAHPHFRANLSQRYPQLHEADLFFCCLLKLKLPYREIGALMQVTPRSVIKRKYRVKIKMGVGTEEEFDTILREA